MTYSFNPRGRWTAAHQMTINGKSDDFELDDFVACAKTASMKRGRAKKILDEVRQAVSRWKEYADAAGVESAQSDRIHATLRLQAGK